MFVNKVILIGRTGKAPEVRYTSGNTLVAAFTLATSRSYTSQNREKGEETEWHNIAVFGKTAEFCRDYIGKGMLLYLEGRLKTGQWEDKDGNRKSKTEIIAERIELIESKKQREAMHDATDGNSEWPIPQEDDDKIPF